MGSQFLIRAIVEKKIKKVESLLKGGFLSKPISPNTTITKKILDFPVGLPALSIAARLGHSEIVLILLKAGAAIDLPCSEGQTPLYMASQYGHPPVVEILLSQGAEVDKIAHNGLTPLHKAAEQGHVAVVSMLLEHHAKVNIKTPQGLTPFHMAAREGHVSVMQELLKWHADVNEATTEGSSPLYLAAAEGRAGAVDLLLQHKAVIDKPNNDGWTPLYVSARMRHQAVVKQLVEAHADVSAAVLIAVKLNDTTTIRQLISGGADIAHQLYMAAKRDHVDVIKFLMKAGANTTIALHTAVFEGNSKALKNLILAGVDINRVITQDGATSFMLAVQLGKNGIAIQLMEAKADIRRAGTAGAIKDKMPLYVAAENGNTVIVGKLKEAYSDIDSLFYFAACDGHFKVVDQLIHVGLDVQIITEEGYTPLYGAAYNQHTDVVNRLIKAGADVYTVINEAVRRGHIQVLNQFITAKVNLSRYLYTAAEKGHVAVVKQLIALRVGVDETYNGLTPLYISVKNKHPDIARMLVNSGAHVASTLYIAAEQGEVNVINQLMVIKPDAVKTVYSDERSLVYVALQNGHTGAAKRLIEVGAETTTALCMAAGKNETTIIGHLLGMKVNVNGVRLSDEAFPLFIAVEKGHVEVVKRLLRVTGIIVDQRKSSGNSVTSFYIACEKGYFNIARLLAEAGADVNQSSSDGTTPLFIAAAQGHDRVVSRLAVEANVNAVRSDGSTALSIAVEGNKLKVVQLLSVHPDVDINKARKNGVTPLFIAVEKNLVSMVDWFVTTLLRERHIRVDLNALKLDSGYTPLFVAILNKNPGMMNILIHGGANVNQVAKNGATPLFVAAEKGFVEGVTLLLAVPGIELDRALSDGTTPLHIASQKGHVSVVELLIKARAQANKTKKTGATPLYEAVEHNQLEVVRRLCLIEGIAVNKATIDGWAPIHIAAANGQETIIQLLLNAGSDVNLLARGMTPLMVAAARGCISVVKILCERHADLSLKNPNGRTAYQLARENSKTDVINFLARLSGLALEERVSPPRKGIASMFRTAAGSHAASPPPDSRALATAPVPKIERAMAKRAEPIPRSRFTIESPIGSGGQATVYKGKYGGVAVAIKVFQKLGRGSFEVFQDECANWIAVSGHPNIVPLMGFSIEEKPCLIMQLAARSLFDLLQDKKEEDIPWSIRFRIARDIAAGLQCLHENDPPMLHQDLKSLNVLLTKECTAQLADFGLSVLQTGATTSPSSTRGLGTPRWTAPELLKREIGPSISTDMYSFGVILWEIASRTFPYPRCSTNEEAVALIVKGVKNDIPSDTPLDYKALIQWCWRDDGASRPKASQVVERLDDLIKRGSAAVSPPVRAGSSLSRSTRGSSPPVADRLASLPRSALGLFSGSKPSRADLGRPSTAAASPPYLGNTASPPKR